MSNRFLAIIVMGVSGAGKSTVAAALAARLGFALEDADAYHPPANVAKMHAGIADDLATTLLLATDKPVLAVPAMNVRMWQHPATRRNVAGLRADGVHVMDPEAGEMACGEFGPGRLPEIERIFAEISHHLATAMPVMAAQPDFADPAHRPLFGKRVLVTAGPTHEPIDPVRYIANRSSGRQGFAIAQAAAEMGMEEFYDAAQARVNSALRQAGTILITHEHADHEGGLVALGDPGALARTRFNSNQVDGNRWTDLLPWPQGARPQPTLAGSDPVAVAPGVVVIPAPSHTPGSQMIFVRLADGREFLFAGDIASFALNWRETRARSRLVGDWFAPENRAEVFAWLRTIRAWQAQAPGLVVVPGHDFTTMIDPEHPTGIHRGFSPPPV